MNEFIIGPRGGPGFFCSAAKLSSIGACVHDPAQGACVRRRGRDRWRTCGETDAGQAVPKLREIAHNGRLVRQLIQQGAAYRHRRGTNLRQSRTFSAKSSARRHWRRPRALWRDRRARSRLPSCRGTAESPRRAEFSGLPKSNVPLPVLCRRGQLKGTRSARPRARAGAASVRNLGCHGLRLAVRPATAGSHRLDDPFRDAVKIILRKYREHRGDCCAGDRLRSEGTPG